MKIELDSSYGFCYNDTRFTSLWQGSMNFCRIESIKIMASLRVMVDTHTEY